ncbi:hypothetical protein SAMN04488038_11158 [Solimonas aquatica]|uniref:Sulfatase N-terminal domain-containing protein n=1 Tax=Solimonas aquatica TaxID=489703 RepID=A0A1H9J8C2_9GAMM|nr:sulfatase-like hydrolase/transferase [Solimonas aquatica]SEQ83130.1 hypothetical protein SAMN04488038_11158 [Solimonas aquatica]
MRRYFEPEPSWLRVLLRSALAYGLLPDLLMNLIARYLGVSHTLANLDYLALGILIPWLPWWLGLPALALTLIADLAMTVAPTYQFDLSKVLETTQELFNLAPSFVLPIVAVVLLGSTALAGLMLRLRAPGAARVRESSCALLLTLLVLGADLALSPNLLTGMDRAVTSVNVAGSPGAFILRELRHQLGNSQPLTLSPAPERASAPIVAGLAQQQLPPKLVLVVVESWGWFKDERARALITAPLTQLAAQRPDLRLELGETLFQGSTVNGELRELCGLRSSSIRLPDPRIQLDHCLPHQLAALGYHSVAMHGYRGSMFNRLHWYPQLGFTERLFDRELLTRLGRESRCGATFPGVCDGDVPALIGRQLDDPAHARQFVYWLSLNAHLPIYESQDPRAAVDCSQSPTTAGDEQECRLAKLHHLLMQSLAEMMARRHDTALVVVGDHAPAFVAGTRREQLSPDHVPHAVLWPNTAVGPHAAAPAR